MSRIVGDDTPVDTLFADRRQGAFPNGWTPVFFHALPVESV
jgi:hypothetical protein